ncbi:MAG: hypothetical protein BM565_13620 [Gammaproteobacteria bacterium MedPE]|nr:MAG: hypothetical protein BM565_13620 [Gammaproteobacteria bacterium MedPE]
MIKNTVTALFVMTLLLGLLAASLLGENHKIETLVNGYTNQLTVDNLPEACLPMQITATSHTREQCLNNNFILNVSLLEYFGVLESDFTVHVRREHFWIPFVVDTVNVSIALVSDNNADDVVFIKNLFQVNRMGGHWQVISMNINDERLKALVVFNQQNLDIEKYIKFNEDNVELKTQTLNLTRLTAKERYLIKFSTNKLLEYIAN